MIARARYVVADAISFMSKLPDGCIAAVVTSPPYYAGKEYERDLSLAQYRQLIADFVTQSARVLRPGGWLCVNIGQTPVRTAEGPRQLLTQHIIPCLMDAEGLLLDADIVWDKVAPTAGVGTRMFGSYPYPGRLLVCYGHEYILRGRKPGRTVVPTSARKASVLSYDEWNTWCRGMWSDIPTWGRGRRKHPAEFQTEVPYRLIRMCTYQGDLVLDPFVGSGTTLAAAALCRRNSIGVDNHDSYYRLARDRFNTTELLGIADLRRSDSPAGALRDARHAGDGRCDPDDAGLRAEDAAAGDAERGHAAVLCGKG